MNDEAFMELALSQARLAAAFGEVPVGAVVVRHGKVIAAGRNAPVDAQDPTAHAEIVALRAAAHVLGNYRLDECELFVTLEPCAMCSGAMLNARLKRVVFGAPEPKTGAAGSVINLFAQAQLNHQTELHGGVLADAGRELLQDFFRQRRADQRETVRQHHPLRDDALRTPDAAFEGLSVYPWRPHYLSNLPALGGLRMHYLDEQTHTMEQGGASYLCLHGGRGWSYAFRHLIPLLLQAGQRVVAPDLIGFGKSDKPKKDRFHTFSRHRQMLLELVEKLDLQNIVLLLPVQGDLLGLTLTMAAPLRYRGLRLMNADGLTMSDEMPLSDGFLLWKQMGQDLTRLHEPVNAATDVAYEIPFPGKGYCAGLRAFAAMASDFENGVALGIAAEAEQFWRDRSHLN